ncbi:MAG: oxygen-independent coproporphyrinogen III oxidase [Bdellovibrionales bacterium]
MDHFFSLIKKYDIPVPRYTSYPAIPNWKNNLDTDEWVASLRSVFSKDSANWSLYLHLPFCETLCTFCGCNNIITKDHKKEIVYIQALEEELSWYIQKVPDIKMAPLRQLHLGGGSPTFFSPENLNKILSTLFAHLKWSDGEVEGAVEVDPRRCRREHLEVLKKFGLNRVSIGVQDFNEKVQTLINRIQPLSCVEECLRQARELGYKSTNFDLIYGLPGQTKNSIRETIEKVICLLPERIALYSLAVVPWIKPAQHLFKDEDLPRGQVKRDLYELSRHLLLNAGYVEVGIDHFSLPTDSMAKSLVAGTLHRNFMGYTEYETDLVLGLGVSAISSTAVGFRQNQKEYSVYLDNLKKMDFTALRSHKLSENDKLVQGQILNLMTKQKTAIVSNEFLLGKLRSFLSDGLVELKLNELSITERGRPFIRNICASLDEYLNQEQIVNTYSSGV